MHGLALGVMAVTVSLDGFMPAPWRRWSAVALPSFSQKVASKIERVRMRVLLGFLLGRALRTRTGRWLITVALLLLSALFFLAYSADTSPDASTVLVLAIVFLVLGVGLLAFTIRLEQMLRVAKRQKRERMLAGRRPTP